MSDSRDSFIREQRIRARKGRKGRGESIISIYLVLRVREREHLLFALVPGFVHAWFSSTRDRVVFLFVRVVVLVVLRGRRGLQSSASVRHDDDISLYRLCLVTTRVSSRGFYPKNSNPKNFLSASFPLSLSVFASSFPLRRIRRALGVFNFISVFHETPQNTLAYSRAALVLKEEEAVEWHWPFLEEQQRE